MRGRRRLMPGPTSRHINRPEARARGVAQGVVYKTGQAAGRLSMPPRAVRTTGVRALQHLHPTSGGPRAAHSRPGGAAGREPVPASYTGPPAARRRGGGEGGDAVVAPAEGSSSPVIAARLRLGGRRVDRHAGPQGRAFLVLRVCVCPRVAGRDGAAGGAVVAVVAGRHRCWLAFAGGRRGVDAAPGGALCRGERVGRMTVVKWGRRCCASEGQAAADLRWSQRILTTRWNWRVSSLFTECCAPRAANGRAPRRQFSRPQHYGDNVAPRRRAGGAGERTAQLRAVNATHGRFCPPAGGGCVCRVDISRGGLKRYIFWPSCFAGGAGLAGGAGVSGVSGVGGGAVRAAPGHDAFVRRRAVCVRGRTPGRGARWRASRRRRGCRAERRAECVCA
jgi:hypothetical protein